MKGIKIIGFASLSDRSGLGMLHELVDLFKAVQNRNFRLLDKLSGFFDNDLECRAGIIVWEGSPKATDDEIRAAVIALGEKIEPL